MVIYEVEIHECVLNSKPELIELSSVAELFRTLNSLDKVTPISVLVCVLRNGVDFGNFIFYLNNRNRTHVIVNEHQGFLVTEKDETIDEPVNFIDERGEIFSVPFQKTMSFKRTLLCLELWLPSQEHSEKFLWLDN